MIDARTTGHAGAAQPARTLSFARAIALLSEAQCRGHHAPGLETLKRTADSFVHIVESDACEESAAWVLSLPSQPQDPGVHIVSRLGPCHVG